MTDLTKLYYSRKSKLGKGGYWAEITSAICVIQTKGKSKLSQLCIHSKVFQDEFNHCPKPDVSK